MKKTESRHAYVIQQGVKLIQQNRWNAYIAWLNILCKQGVVL